jgi:hypothetical protein
MYTESFQANNYVLLALDKVLQTLNALCTAFRGLWFEALVSAGKAKGAGQAGVSTDFE